MKPQPDDSEPVRVEVDAAEVQAPRAQVVAAVLEEGEQVERAWTAEDFADSDWEHPDTRPRLRGWLHLFAFLTSIVAGAVLIPLAAVLGARSGFSVDQPFGAWLLVGVWTAALAGVALKTVWPTAPRWLGTSLYIGLGWVAVFVLGDILRLGGVTVVVLLGVGGLLYTVGGVAYAARRPNPWPGVFGYHEVFHAMTIVAALCHHLAVYFAMYGSPFA